jgi:large subunit ribosomal protein L10Ae
MITTKKARKFVETVELQVGLRDYDPEKDKRFQGSVKLPNKSHFNVKVCVIGSVVHLEEAKAAGIESIDADGLKAFNKDKAKIKKWAKKFDVLIASDALMKQLTKLVGNILVKLGKHPLPINEGEKVLDKIDDLKHNVKFQLKKVLCLGTAVGHVDLTEEQIRQNINTSVNFLVSLLKKGWQNIRTLHIKTTMGQSIRIYG